MVSCHELGFKRRVTAFAHAEFFCRMAPAKFYTAVDFKGPFLDWLLEHFRQQQKAGEGLDLHLQAENPEDKVSLHQVNKS